jgi:hypothetical protein
MTENPMTAQQANTANDFSFSIGFRHNTSDPALVSQALAMKPVVMWRAGDPILDNIRNSSYWCGEIVRASEEDFESGLRMVEFTLTSRKQFCEQFVASGGEIELTLNHKIRPGLTPEEGESAAADFGTKLAELTLYPAFLTLLSQLGVALRLQAWA